MTLYPSDLNFTPFAYDSLIEMMGNDSKKDNRSAFSISEEWIKYPEDVVDLAVFLAGQPDIGPTA